MEYRSQSVGFVGVSAVLSANTNGESEKGGNAISAVADMGVRMGVRCGRRWTVEQARTRSRATRPCAVIVCGPAAMLHKKPQSRQLPAASSPQPKASCQQSTAKPQTNKPKNKKEQ